jgi:predicted membrane protein (TIGR00267 family)
MNSYNHKLLMTNQDERTQDPGKTSRIDASSNSSDAVSNSTQAEQVKPLREIHKHIRGRGVISNIALGISDGLVTNIAFLAGFSGTGALLLTVRLAGVAAMIAGGVSMFFGGILAGRSERDLFAADAKRESLEIENEPEEERQELIGYYLGKGLTPDEARIVVDRITSDKQKWLEDILVHELHIHKTSLGDPYKTGISIGLAFVLGALVPLLPYLLLPQIGIAMYLSVSISLLFLFVVGFWKGKIADKTPWRGALEMLIVGIVASALLYGIGQLLVFV